MEILEILYQEEHKNRNFVDRKVVITSKKTFLKGCRKSGKTALIIDHLGNYNPKEYLYINLLDERLESLHVKHNLQNFIEKNGIKLVVIENYNFSFDLPKVEEIILSHFDTSLHVEDFEDLYLYPLDFEEFIAFDRKHSNIEHIFNLFANTGTFPHLALESENESKQPMQELIRLSIPNPTKFEIYKRLSELQSTKISLFQLYNQLKPNIKISKDKLYAYVEELQNEGLLYLLSKYDSSKSNKKVYLVDFSIKNALSFKKDFLKRFENILFSELLKRYEEIFFTEALDFYIPSVATGLICAPFSLKESIEKRLFKELSLFKTLDIHTIEIITLGNEGSFELENITCSFIPFWDWALQS